MIKSENGECRIIGDVTEISADLVVIVENFRESISAIYDKQCADEVIAYCGKVAVYLAENDNGLSDESELKDGLGKILRDYSERSEVNVNGM